MTTAAIIVAAGKGTRAGGGLPKQWRPLAGRRVIDWTLAAFQSSDAIDHIVLVVSPEDSEAVSEFSKTADIIVAMGGADRGASVQNGLAALVAIAPQKVLVHDAARPCISHDIITAVLAALDTHQGAAPAVAVADALWTGSNGFVNGVRDRSGLFSAQTPQGFDFKTLVEAYGNSDTPEADDVAIARRAGVDVAIVSGHPDNLKITTPVDFERAERILQNRQQTEKEDQMDIRLGNGFDVHRFTDGDAVILCGVKVPHTRALKGHSDADVGMHAITDAIYGALADGDIGQHFPPTDPQWKGAASDIFLRHAVDLANNRGFSISNIDCTLICERPKIGPHAAVMRAALAEIMGLSADRISVKATTSEKLGFTGREEGIAAIATATLIKP